MYEPERKVFLQALESILGYPYIWGGESPDVGFDCSGAIRQCWISAGFHMPTDRTAQSMCVDFWKDCYIEHDEAEPGDLFFYGSNMKNITHAMIVLRRWPNGRLILAGARGGNASTINSDVAYAQWALVDICSENYWQRNFVVAVNPFLKLDPEPASVYEIEMAKVNMEVSIKKAQIDNTYIPIVKKPWYRNFF